MFISIYRFKNINELKLLQVCQTSLDVTRGNSAVFLFRKVFIEYEICGGADNF